MALDKQKVPVVLDKGIDTKTNRKQLQGKLLDLRNGIFQTGMEIRKRNGYLALPSLGKGVMLSAYSNELVVLDGTNLYSYNATSQTEVNKGALPTVSLSTQTVIRNTQQQVTQDMAINGTLQCFCWVDSSGGVRYSVFDTSTEQSIVNNALVDVLGTVCKVLSVGTKFVILYFDATNFTLRYKAIDIATPTVIASAVTVASDINHTVPAFDATIINGSIYFAYNSSSARISLNTISSTLVLGTQKNFGTDNCDVISVFTDTSFNVWVAYGISGNNTPTPSVVKVFVLNQSMVTTVLTTTTIDSFFDALGNGHALARITGIVNSTTASIYYEVVVAQIVAGEPLNFIKQQTVTIAGSVGTASVFNRGVALASKIFTFGSNWFFLMAYQSNLQPSYFLVRNDDVIVGKLAPSEGGGYPLKPILPEFVSPSSGVFETASLIKDSLTVQNGVIAAQTGVQLAIFTFISTAPSKFVLGKNLHVNGAIVKMYDGGSVVEHGFNVYPEGMYTAWDPANPTTGGGVGPGASVADVNKKSYCMVYEWTDNQGQPHRSAPSIPIQVSFPKNVTPTTITGDITSSGTPPFPGNQITNVSGSVVVGDYVNLVSPTGRVTWGWNCQVTVVAGTTITVSPGFQLVASTGRTFLISKAPLSLFFTAFPQPTTMAPGFSKINGFFGQVIVAPPTTISNYPPATYFRSGAYSNEAGFDTNNPPNGQGTTKMYYALDNYIVPLELPTLRMTDKQNVSLAVYATQTNGTIFYRTSDPVNLIYNDKTVDYVLFNDTTADDTLIGNQELYTSLGEVENIGVPAMNVAATFKSRAIGVLSENPLAWWPSKQVIPGFPVEFTDVFEQNIDSRIQRISSVGAMDDKIVFFGPTSLFYVVGNGPAPNGTNNDYTEAQLISSDVGCLNQRSVILTPGGLMFQSQKGIYLLDRSLAVQYIGSDVEMYNNVAVTSAQLMDDVNQVRFTLENNTELVYDYFYNQWDIFETISAVDSGIFQDKHTFIKPTGEIWQETPGVFSDNGAPILLSLTSNWLSFANIQGFQRIYSLLFLGHWFSPHTLTFQFYSNYDESTVVQTVVVPALTDPYPKAYQFRVFLNEFMNKSESVKIKITESQSGTPGQGLSLANLAFIVGVKGGLYKVSAAESYG